MTKIEGSRVLPLSRDVAARKDWLRQREVRLKSQLSQGDLRAAQGTLSEILESAKPGDINPTKAEALQKMLREAMTMVERVQGFSGGIVTR